MFREITRRSNVISNDECINILINEKRGVLSVIGDKGYPYGMPMNHFYNCDDGAIYFHCGRKGHRLDSIAAENKVSFCAYDSGYKKDDEWALNIKSVIVFGKIEIINDKKIISDISRKLCYKFTDDEKYIDSEIEKHINATLLLKLTPEHISGKSVTES